MECKECSHSKLTFIENKKQQRFCDIYLMPCYMYTEKDCVFFDKEIVKLQKLQKK